MSGPSHPDASQLSASAASKLFPCRTVLAGATRQIAQMPCVALNTYKQAQNNFRKNGFKEAMQLVTILWIQAPHNTVLSALAKVKCCGKDIKYKISYVDITDAQEQVHVTLGLRKRHCLGLTA